METKGKILVDAEKYRAVCHEIFNVKKEARRHIGEARDSLISCAKALENLDKGLEKDSSLLYKHQIESVDASEESKDVPK